MSALDVFQSVDDRRAFDGVSAPGFSPTHTYAAAGTYNVTLTGADAFGAQGTAQTTATVSAAMVLNPISNKTVNLGETLSLTVSAVIG